MSSAGLFQASTGGPRWMRKGLIGASSCLDVPSFGPAAWFGVPEFACGALEWRLVVTHLRTSTASRAVAMSSSAFRLGRAHLLQSGTAGTGR